VLTVADIRKYSLLPPKTAQVKTSFRCRSFKSMMDFAKHISLYHTQQKNTVVQEFSPVSST